MARFGAVLFEQSDGIIAGIHAGQCARDPHRMTGAKQRRDMLFAGRTIAGLIGKGADPPSSGIGDCCVERAVSDRRRQSIGILAGDARLAQHTSHAPGAQAAPRHAARLGLGPGAVVDLAELGHAIGDRRRVDGLPFPAARPHLAPEIIGQPPPRGREALDIAQCQPLEAGTVERWGGLTGNSDHIAMFVPH